MTRRYHSQYFIDNHVYEWFLGHGHASDETQQGGSLVQKLSVHQVDSLVQQLQQRFPSPPHVSNERPQRRVLFHRYPSLTLDDVTRLEGSLLLGTLCNLLSSLLLFRRFFGKMFLLHPFRLVFLREGFKGLRCRRCICRGGEYCSSRHVACECHSRRAFLPFSSTKFTTYQTRQQNGFSLGCFLFSCQGLFDAVPRCTTDGSQGGRFTRSNGGRNECQERKETTSLISSGWTTTTHDPFSTSSTFGRHDVFETMKGTRCRHAPLGFFSVCPPPLATRARPPAAGRPPPDPDCG